MIELSNYQTALLWTANKSLWHSVR